MAYKGLVTFIMAYKELALAFYMWLVNTYRK
jgi:hypothetical protein